MQQHLADIAGRGNLQRAAQGQGIGRNIKGVDLQTPIRIALAFQIQFGVSAKKVMII
ncbi:MAG: hypothetical protein ACI8R4_002601, partial [Paracoccaceae bacterium]